MGGGGRGGIVTLLSMNFQEEANLLGVLIIHKPFLLHKRKARLIGTAEKQTKGPNPGLRIFTKFEANSNSSAQTSYHL